MVYQKNIDTLHTFIYHTLRICEVINYGLHRKPQNLSYVKHALISDLFMNLRPAWNIFGGRRKSDNVLYDSIGGWNRNVWWKADLMRFVEFRHYEPMPPIRPPKCLQ